MKKTNQNELPKLTKKIPLATLETTAPVRSGDSKDGPHSIVNEESSAPKKEIAMKNKSKSNPAFVLIASVVIVAAGSITGFGLSKVTSSDSNPTVVETSGIEEGTGKVTDGEIKKGTLLGNTEKSGDEAEGVLVAGGINGEGSHRILRPGGPNQTVYLTSSVVDLDQLVGHKVKVWGDTFSAQSAGWLMDVVTVEVVELNAPKPFEENDN